MNRPPETFIVVQESRLFAFSTSCFEKAGLDHDHAALISRLLVNSDLRGVRSHGTRAVNGYCRAFEQGNINPRPNVRQIHETPTAVVFDGDGTLGYLPMVEATRGAIRKAKEVGLGMGLVRHIGHYGSAGHYTRRCAEWIIERERQGYKHMALIGETAADVRDVMIEGEAGIMKCAPPARMPIYEPSKRRLTWASGAIATAYSGDTPDVLRGPSHDSVWADEPAKWRYAQDAWDNMEFGLRIGNSPQVVATTTPRPIKLIRDLVADPKTHVTP